MITAMLQTAATNDKHDSCNVALQTHTELINLHAHQWRGAGTTYEWSFTQTQRR